MYIVILRSRPAKHVAYIEILFKYSIHRKSKLTIKFQLGFENFFIKNIVESTSRIE